MTWKAKPVNVNGKLIWATKWQPCNRCVCGKLIYIMKTHMGGDYIRRQCECKK